MWNVCAYLCRWHKINPLRPIRWIRYILSFIGLLLVALLVLVFALANIPRVQTWAARQGANWLGERSGLDVQVGKLALKPFTTLALKEVLIREMNGDTLVYAALLECEVDLIRPGRNEYFFDHLLLSNIVLHYEEGDSASNWTPLLNVFTTANTSQPSAQPHLAARSIQLENSRITYIVSTDTSTIQGINFNNLSIDSLGISIRGFQMRPDGRISGDIRHLALREKSGFVVDTLAVAARIDSSGMQLGQLHLVTPNTHATANLDFGFKHWGDFNDFTSRVNIDAQFDSSWVAMSDVAYFSDNLMGWTDRFFVRGDLNGKINALQAESIELGYGTGTAYSGAVEINGLPNTAETFLVLDARQVRVRVADLRNFQLSPYNAHGHIAVPRFLDRIAEARFSGSFIGYFNEFVAYGALQIPQGELITDVELSMDTLGNLIVAGSLKTEALDLSTLTGSDDLGNIAASVTLDAATRNGEASGNASGTISQLDFRGYSYQDISLAGDFANREFEGRIVSNDDNFNFTFDGLVNAGTNDLYTADFKLDVYHLDLETTRLLTNPARQTLSGSLALQGQGRSIESFFGTLNTYNLSYCRADEEFFFDTLTVVSQNQGEVNQLRFNSRFADANVIGNYHLFDLPRGLAYVFGDVTKSTDQPPAEILSDNFNFLATVRNLQPLSGLLDTSLYIAPGTSASGSVNVGKRSMQVQILSDSLAWKTYATGNVSASVEKVQRQVSGDLATAVVHFSDSLELENLNWSISGTADTLHHDLDWQNRDDRSQAALTLSTWSAREGNFSLRVEPGELSFIGTNWRIPEPAFLSVDSQAVEISRFQLLGQDQQLLIHGNISKNPDDVLILETENLNLSPFAELLGLEDLGVAGTANIEARIQDVYNQLRIESRARIDNLVLDGNEVGTLRLETSWNNNQEAVRASGTVVNERITALDFRGEYYPRRESDNLDLVLEFEQFSLDVLNTFDLSIISDVTGQVNGDVAVHGTLDHPIIEGTVDFNEMRFNVNYLNTYYTYNDEVRIGDGWIGIDYKPIQDAQGHTGYVVAQVYHDNFTNWNFDAMIDVDNFFLLNTTPEMNSLFYGTAYATGEIQVAGYLDNLEMNIDVRSEKNTSVKLPLGGATEVSFGEFVQFVGGEDEDSLKAQGPDLTGIDMTLNIEATPDAEIQLIFDEQVGDILKARGTGEIEMRITPLGDFTMYGPFEVYSGEYTLTFQNIINKKFLIERGGTINWYGDPYNADINLSAVYRTRASLHDIMVEAGDQYRSREPVDLKMKLSNRLFNPDIAFEVALPNGTENERSQLASVMSTETERNKQVFGLLVMNRFLPPASSQEGGLGLTGASGTEFISNTVSNWLSTLSNAVNIGFNWRAGDAVSNEEIALALSTELFNDRILLSGNFGVATGPNGAETGNRQNNLIGDFELQYLITEDGRLRLKVFNRSNTFDIGQVNPNGFTQGVGLVYQQDFNTFQELADRLGDLFRREEEENPVP